jgi:hypothetical protein
MQLLLSFVCLNSGQVRFDSQILDWTAIVIEHQAFHVDEVFFKGNHDQRHTIYNTI